MLENRSRPRFYVKKPLIVTRLTAIGLARLNIWTLRDRVSAISVPTVSPQRRRLGLYFDLLEHNVKAEDFETFGDQLLRRVGRAIIQVIDRCSIHRSAAQKLLLRHPRRLSIEWLPANAPELNPDEQVWNHAKYTDLANFVPENVLNLGRAVADSLRRTRKQQTLLRSFFHHAKLAL